MLQNGIDSSHNTSYISLARPIDNIMMILHHYHANIDLLKIDIDGPEFEVLEQSVFEVGFHIVCFYEPTYQGESYYIYNLGIPYHTSTLTSKEPISILKN